MPRPIPSQPAPAPERLSGPELHDPASLEAMDEAFAEWLSAALGEFLKEVDPSPEQMEDTVAAVLRVLEDPPGHAACAVTRDLVV